MRTTAWAPGRICLFGEHQDYFGLEVATAALELGIGIAAEDRADRLVTVDLPDTGEQLVYDLDALPPLSPRAYLLSVLRLFAAQNQLPTTGWSAVVRGDLPRGAGASSSTALTVAWTRLVAARAGLALSDAEVADAAHRAEVVAFGEPGGQMDHWASALGGALHLTFDPVPAYTPLALPPGGTFVLIDSGEPKDTLAILHRVRSARAALFDRIPSWDWRRASSAAAIPPPDSGPPWTPAEHTLLHGTLLNRDVSSAGIAALRRGDAPAAGRLLTAHHAILRDILGTSTPRIDALLDAACAAGAWGGKINGSGGGGTCFAYCAVEGAEAVERAVGEVGG
jgi:galactokinase